MPPWEPVITHHTRTHFLTHAYTVAQWPLLQSLSLVSHRRRITLKVSYWVSILALPSSGSMLWAKEIGGLSVRPPIWFFFGWLGWFGLKETISPSPYPPSEFMQLYTPPHYRRKMIVLYIYLAVLVTSYHVNVRFFWGKKRKVASRYIKLAH